MSVGLHRERKTLVSSGQAWLGTIPSNWPTKRIKSLFNCFGGGTPSKDEASYWAGSIPWASPKDFAGSELSDSEDHITEQAVRASATRIIAPGSVMLVVRSGVLRHTIPVAINTVAMALNQDLKALVPRAHLSPEYLRYLIAGKNDQLLSHWAQLGCTVESLDTVRVLNTEVPVPPREEQTAIVSFLDRETARIDALIEKKRRLIELLREKRAAVITRATTRGLASHADIADSGLPWLGPIPKEWKVMSLARLTTKLTNGYVGPTRDMFVDEGVPYLQSLHIKQNRIEFGNDYFVTPEWSRRHAKSILRQGDVLVVQTGDIGQVAHVPKEWAGANCHALIVCSPDPQYIEGEYLAWLLTSAFGNAALLSCQTGALHPHLNCGVIKHMLLPVPPLHEQRAIVNHVKCEVERLRDLEGKAEMAIRLLSEKRSALIAAAVTGQIGVGEAT